ncbi:hypothetical protein FRC07_008213 [Ceratobasidium sp. 392]|nr:hypothetical protein FRC07_008213 [Ceratobasidium sp. 392]
MTLLGGTPNLLTLNLKDLLKNFKEMPKYDEYTEIVLVGPKKSDTLASDDDNDNDPSRWEFFFVDHFNRKILTQSEFEKDPSDSASPEQPYREWMKLVTSDNSHYYRPSPNDKKQYLGRKIAQQIVWDYQTTHVVKDADIEGSFSISDCSSLLSALQKKRVSDKQCQKMIKAVIQRFLRGE